MDWQGTEELAEQLRWHYEGLARPFPYEDCRRVRREAGGNDDELIPDLDLYFSEIAGHCSWGKRLLKWSRERAQAAQSDLKRSFFERHPQYRALQPLITETVTPQLSEALTRAEEARHSLLELLERLLSRPDPTGLIDDRAMKGSTSEQPDSHPTLS